MATADQVKALVRSHGEGDDDQFYSVALQVAARAARSGQNQFAKDLRELVDSVRSHQVFTKRLAPVVPVSQPKGELATLLSVTYPDDRLSELSLSEATRMQLELVAKEQRLRSKLASRGLTPSHRLLLIGPPGTGKTASAQALAGELSLPLFSIRLDGLITKYMGETAAKLRLIFDALAATRGVYFFDEVDALAGDRLAANDIGEMRRVLNSFLQFLELDNSESLLIAASNHPQLLDQAIFRRFDLVIRYDLPDQLQVEEVIRNRLKQFDLSAIQWPRVTEAASGLSHADVAAAASAAARSAALEDQDALRTDQLARALEDRVRRLQLLT